MCVCACQHVCVCTCVPVCECHPAHVEIRDSLREGCSLLHVEPGIELRPADLRPVPLPTEPYLVLDS